MKKIIFTIALMFIASNTYGIKDDPYVCRIPSGEEAIAKSADLMKEANPCFFKFLRERLKKSDVKRAISFKPKKDRETMRAMEELVASE